MGEGVEPNEMAKFLHENIPESRIEEIREYLDKLQIPDGERCYDENMKPAAALAIECERYDIYKLLVSKGICLGLNEDIQKLFDGQPPEKKMKIQEKISDIHRDNIKDANPEHLLILISKSSHSHDTSEIDRQSFSERISKAFEDLNAVKLIAPILKVASTSKRLKIVFDFNHESVESLDPRKSQHIMGTTYYEDFYIYIGAKGLLDEGEDYCRALGVLAHELCHYALNLLYDNICKPYANENQVKMQLYITIVEATEMKKDADEIIGGAFEKTDVLHEELIVRVPHLAALYKDDENELKKISENFKELFQFYEEITLVDLQREYPLMEAKRKIIGLNASMPIMWNSDIEIIPEVLKIYSESNDKFLFVSSNFPQLTMCAISHKFKVNIEDGSIILAEIKTLQDETYFDYAVKAISLCSKPKMIINCDGQGIDEAKKIVTRFNKNQVDQRIVFLYDQSRGLLSHNSLNIEHSWNHLTEDFKQKLLDKKINFQGNEIQLGSLLTDLSSIESIPFNDFFSDRRITIGKIEKAENYEIFIERKFLTPDLKKFGSRFEEKEEFNTVLDFSDVLKSAEQNRMILLSDEPGMGKSTTFKMIHAKLIEKYSLRWVVFIDLKKHCSAFKIENNIPSELNNCEEVTKFLSQKLLKIENFEAQVFAHLFNENRAILLMDGLDEICPSFKDPVYDFMSAYRKYSNNQLWVSTRPHLVEELKEKLHPNIFKLKPFTEEDRRNFFKISLNDEDQNIEQKLEEVETFLTKLKMSFQRNHFVFNPLMLKMIAECMNDDQSMKLSDANLYSIYEEFTIKMIERCMQKGPEARKSVTKTVSNTNLIEFYQKVAFRICFYDGNEYTVPQMIKSCFANTSTPSLDDIVRVGLIFSYQSGNFQFIHRTFAEFYVAKYFHETIFQGKYLPDDELKLILDTFFVALKRDDCEMILKLLDSAIESLGVRKSSTIQLISAAFSLKIDSKIIHQLIEGGHFNLIKTSFNNLCLNPERLLMKGGSLQNNVIMTAVLYNSIGFTKPFFDFLKGFLSPPDQFKKMLIEQNKENKNIFHHALSNDDPEVFSFVVEEVEALEDRDLLVNLLTQSGKDDENLLLLAIFRHSIAVVKHLFFIYKKILTTVELQKILTRVEALKDRDLLVYLLTQSGENDESLFHLAVAHKSFVFVKYLFSICTKTLNADEFKKVLTMVDSNNQNVLHFVSLYKDLEVFRFVVKEVEAFNDRDLLVDLLTQSGKNDESLFHLAVFRHSFEFVKYLFSICTKTLNADEFKKFLTKVDTDNRNVLQCASICQNLEVFRFVVEEVESLEDRDLLVNLLTQSGENDESLFHLAVSHQSFDFVKYLFSICTKTLNRDEFKMVLTMVDSNNHNVLHYASICQNLEVFRFVVKEVEAFNDRDLLVNLLTQSGKNDESLFHLAIFRQSFAFVKNLFSIYKQILNADELKKILSWVDTNNRYLFHDPKVLSFVIDEVKALGSPDDAVL